MLVLGCALASAVTWADSYPNDFAIWQLGSPISGGAHAFAGAQTNFQIWAREMGAALTAVNLMPPSSLGHAGFSVNGELSVVNLNPAGQSYTSCPNNQPCFVMPTQGSFSSPLLIPSVHIRKGLPWSFETGARIAWIDHSRMAAGTIEVKWSVNEGFAYLPDIGVRGYGTRLFNTRDFDLTAAGLDIGIGKRFAIGGMVTLTPYVGWNLTWVACTSGNVDFNPQRTLSDSISGPNAQLTDTTVFNEVNLGSNSHNRFYGGLRFIGGVLQLGAEISYAGMGTVSGVAMPAVTAYNVTIGLDY
jgi:hypothetical protein